MRCSGCGKPVSQLSGGVGFWDLAGKAPAAAPPAMTTPGPANPQPDKSTGKKLDRLLSGQARMGRQMAVLFIVLIAVALCSVLGNWLLLMRLPRELSNRQPTDPGFAFTQEDPLLSDVSAVPSATSELEPVPHMPENVQPPLETKQDTTFPPFLIPLWEASSESSELFRVEAGNNATEFTWQKKNESGIFLDVSDEYFDVEKRQDQFSGNMVSILKIQPGHSDISGEYRCVIKYLDGSSCQTAPQKLEMME